MSTITTTCIAVVEVSRQGPPGPPGPDGPGFTSRMGNFSEKAPVADTIPVVPSSAYAFTILGLLGLKVSSGSLRLSIQINDVDVQGLSNISVTDQAQNINATGANAVAVGDRVTVVISNVLAASLLEFTMK